MGWWSCTIMGGDEPCDITCELHDIIECDAKIIAYIKTVDGYEYVEDIDDCDPFIDNMTEEQQNVINNIIRESLESNIDRIRNFIKDNEYNTSIVHQVLAVMIMSRGCKMEVEDQQAILQQIQYEIDEINNGESGWNDPNERLFHLTDLYEKVKTYNLNGGTPVEVASEGLFDKIFESLSTN